MKVIQAAQATPAMEQCLPERNRAEKAETACNRQGHAPRHPEVKYQ
jgi:hypothetical protein